MKTKHLFITPFFIFILTFCSCKKMVEVDTPHNELVTAAAFSDSSNANSAILGIYVNIMNSTFDFNIANGVLAVYSGMSSDELYPTRGFPEEDEFYQNNILINPDNYVNVNFWQSAYKFIYQANACIEGLEGSKSLPQSIKKKLLGEAKFIRAYLYFNLINLFGDVPYVTKTDFHVNATLPRTEKLTIYSSIEDDLKSAESLLPENDVNASRIRPDKSSATALLARVYLFHEKWNEAEQAASRVLNNPIYNLESSLNSVFLPASKEVIWQIVPVDPGYNTPVGAHFNPTPSGKPRYGLTDNLVNSFEATDLRKSSWLKTKTVNSIFYTYPNKYKLRFDGNTSPSEYFVVLRLAEQHLIRAEARARQNNISGALTGLNLIRNRAGLANSLATTQPDVLTAIEHEKRVELFCEEGHRWFDLKRTNRASLMLGPIKAPNWQTTDVLYPIPFSELQYNPFLVQNPGY